MREEGQSCTAGCVKEEEKNRFRSAAFRAPGISVVAHTQHPEVHVTTPFETLNWTSDCHGRHAGMGEGERGLFPTGGCHDRRRSTHPRSIRSRLQHDPGESCCNPTSHSPEWMTGRDRQGVFRSRGGSVRPRWLLAAGSVAPQSGRSWSRGAA